MAVILVAGCGGGQNSSQPESASTSTFESSTVAPGADPLGGIVEITISGIGSDEVEAKALVTPRPAAQQPGATTKDAAQLTNSPTLEFKRIASSSTDVGVRGAGGKRYVSASFAIRNANQCADLGNCPASPLERNNVTMLAVATPTTQLGSALIRLDRFDGTPANAAIVSEMKPGHAMNTSGTRTEPGLASFQVFREAELPPPDPRASYVLPYGFVVNNVDGTSRTLPANPAAQQFDGVITFSFAVPLQASAEEDPHRISVAFQFAEDDNVRVTQSLEERHAAGDLATLARASSFSTTDIVTLGCDRLPTEILANTLCSVRLTGPATAPTAFLVQSDPAALELQSALSDEFDGNALDRSKWCTRYVFGGVPGEEAINQIQSGFEDSFCTRFSMFGGGMGDSVDDEQQRYRDIDANGNLLHIVSDGSLKLRTSKTLPAPFANPHPVNFSSLPNNDGTVKYESAMISSKASFRPEDANTTYIMKARVSLPDVQGTFPALWLYPEINAAGGHWPPEIDIMEGPLNRVEDIETQFLQGAKLVTINGVPPAQTVSGQRERTFVNNELINPYAAEFNGELPGYETQYGRWIAPASLRERFVEVGAHWRQDGVCFFIDNMKTLCENYKWLTQSGASANPAVLIFNQAIGGSFAGRHGIEDSKLPAETEVDWIRVWKHTQR